MFREHTPIERYKLHCHTVHVKRDDLYAAPPAPPLGKLRGCRRLLARLYAGGVRLIGCWDTRVSALGLGVAACCTELLGLRALLAWPARAGDLTPEPLRRAEELGAQILPVRAGRISISFAEARREVERRGGAMLPFGMECSESVEAVRLEAATVPARFTTAGTVVVSSGSGVTLTGILLGLQGRPARIIGVSAGRSPETILRCVRRYAPLDAQHAEIQPAHWPYHHALDYPSPFPANTFYDRKAWRFLVENFEQLPRPVLFWNVGA